VSILGFLIAVSLLLGGLAWGFFVWTVRSGQYEDPEGAKYRMLEDDEGTAPPTSTSTSIATPTPTSTSIATPTSTATSTATSERER
jgi:cbb3-type cytochrome oxidase maturation protein